MPPKLSKKEQEEQARLEEEQRQREEEERIRLEAEELKKYEPAVLQTGLKCILTEFYVQEVLKSQNPEQFTLEFIERYLSKNKIRENFRDIDLELLVDFTLFNINFACESLFNEFEIYILINILWEILRQNDPKYTHIQEDSKDDDMEQQKKMRNKVVQNLKNKNKEGDLKLLQKLLVKHSFSGAVQQENSDQMKVFNGESLKLIIKYIKETYFSHYNLYIHVAQNDQQSLDVYQSIFIDEPQVLPEGLDDATYHALDGQDNQSQKQDGEQEQQDQEQQINDEEEESKPEEEEPLDEISQQILMEKIREAKNQMEQKLQERKQQQEEKLETLQTTKGKKK